MAVYYTDIIYTQAPYAARSFLVIRSTLTRMASASCGCIPRPSTNWKRNLERWRDEVMAWATSSSKEALKLFISGWVEYYKLARMKKTLETIDKWLRRRIRMCIWKSWKNPRTRIANLIKCGVPKWQAYKHGWVKGYWRASSMPDCTHAMSGHNLYRAGYRFLMDYYVLVS